MHMHTHKPKQPKARHKDAPCDRMQPPGERKWLYPPKQCFYFSQTLLHGLGGELYCFIQNTALNQACTICQSLHIFAYYQDTENDFL